VNLPPEGLRAIGCPLDVVTALLEAAAPEAVGGERVQARLVAKIAAIARTVDAADAASPKSRAVLKRTARQLNGFIHGFERALARGTIAADVGAEVLPSVRQAAANLAPLLRR
jgi:hypothetical protein